MTGHGAGSSWPNSSAGDGSGIPASTPVHHSTPNSSPRNTHSNHSGSRYHPLQTVYKPETYGAGPAITADESYPDAAARRARGAAAAGSRPAQPSPIHQGQRLPHRQYSSGNDRAPPPSPQYHDSRRHPHATAADWSSGARCAPPSSDFLEHGRNPQMDVLQPNTHRGGKQASTSFAARAREFLGRDKSNPASPVRDGVVPSTEGFEGLGFDDTQAFLERQRANGNGSMVNESIVGFEPQYAQPNAGRANVAGSPSAARRAPPYSAEPYVAEQVAAAAPAAIHGRLQEQLYHRGRIASADVPGPPHHPHRHFDSDVTARPPHSPLKPHQSPGRPSPEDNNHYFSEYPGHRDPYLDRIAPIAHNSQHIPHTAAGFAVEHFPDLAVPSLHSTFATSSFIPQVPASANEWCR